jgi:hypothetical protein
MAFEMTQTPCLMLNPSDGSRNPTGHRPRRPRNGIQHFTKRPRGVSVTVANLGAYLVFAIALGGGRFLSGNDKAAPSSQLFQ